jgi:hypothetical protein
MNLSRTITVHWDGNIESPDEFVTDLLESDSDVPRQFCTYYIRVNVVLHSRSQCVFRLKELKTTM